MKKVIMMIGAVAIFASVHAASVNWSFAASGSTYAGYTVYLSTSAGTFTDLAALEATVLGGTVADASGTLAGTRNAQATGSIKGLAASKAFDYYWVVVKDNDYWVSGKMTVTTGTEDAGAVNATFAAADGKTLLSGTATGSFSATPAPEPTSGLLILLGMAGLALKRKVA